MKSGGIEKRSLSKTVIATGVSFKEIGSWPKTIKATQKTHADFIKRFAVMKNKKCA